MRIGYLNHLATACFFAIAMESSPQELLWGEETEGFRLALGFEKTTFRTGEPIVATVVLQNNSDRSRQLARFFPPEVAYRVVITRDRNEPVQRISSSPRFSIVNMPIGGFASETNHIRINTEFDILKPGSYVITITGVVPPASKSEQVPVLDYVPIRSDNAIFQIVETSQGGNVNIESLSVTQTQNSAADSFGSFPKQNTTATLKSKPLGAIIANALTAVSGRFTLAQKVSGGIIMALFTLVFAILWRASRRKRA